MKKAILVLAVVVLGVFIASISSSHPIIALGGLVLCFAATIRMGMQQDREDRDFLQPIWQKLTDGVLEVSLLVSKKCPDNRQAHQLVIEAAQCLVYPDPGRRIATRGDVQRRYEAGLAKLEEARKIAGV